MGTTATGTHQTAYIRYVRKAVWQAFRAEALRLGLTQAEALEIMIAGMADGESRMRKLLASVTMGAWLGAAVGACAAAILFMIVVLFVFTPPVPAPEGSYYPEPATPKKD